MAEPTDRRNTAMTDANTRDIAALTTQVAIVATIVENSEKRREEDVQLIRKMAESFERVNEKLSTIASLTSDVSQLKEDQRVARHDLNQVMNAQGALPILDKKATELSVKVESLEKVLDQTRGGLTVLKAIWAFIAAGGAGAVFWIYTRLSGGGDVTGL